MSEIELLVRSRRIQFPRRPLIMGIININDDSFCNNGRVNSHWALRQAIEIANRGADIIDVGGESARTNRPPINPKEELKRILPFIEGFSTAIKTTHPRDPEQIWPPLLSINTWRPEVVGPALKAGCDLLNDMGALPDNRNALLCAKANSALLIMHSKGPPKVSHTHVTYQNIMEELLIFFREKISLALQANLPREAIILDPGIDFSKQKTDNLKIYRQLDILKEFKRPILLPVSRKSVIGRVLNIQDPNERDAGTIACIVAGMLRGGCIFRVHNVDAAYLTIRSIFAMESRLS